MPQRTAQEPQTAIVVDVAQKAGVVVGKRSNHRKSRGIATQAHLARDLRECGLYPYATDAGPGRSGRDVLNTPGVAIEVKATASFSPHATLRQAESNRGNDLPMGVCRLNGQGPKSIDEWITLMRYGDVIEFFGAISMFSYVKYGRRGFDPLDWTKHVRGTVHTVPAAVITARQDDPITMDLCTVIRWGDVKRLIRDSGLNQ